VTTATWSRMASSTASRSLSAVAPARFLQLAAEGELIDAPTLAAVALAARALKTRGG